MGTVATAIAKLPNVYQIKYASFFVGWINELLEKLSGEGLILPSTVIESGFPVSNDVWITRPTGCREIKKIWDPENADRLYSWEEVNSKIKLTDVEVEEDAASHSVTAFTLQLTTGITVNLASITADQLKNSLLVITAGSYSGRTYIIGSNAASSGSTCAITFLHSLAAALTAGQATAGKIISPDYYVMMKYVQGLTKVSTTTDEIPIDDEFEDRIVRAWLEFACTRQSNPPSSEETKAAKAEFKEVLDDVKGERNVVPGRIEPRFSPGLDQYKYGENAFSDEKDYEQDLDIAE